MLKDFRSGLYLKNLTFIGYTIEVQIMHCLLNNVIQRLYLPIEKGNKESPIKMPP